MVDALGLRRLMGRETNISDLLHYLTDRDPAAWAGIVEHVATSARETGISSRKRADLVLHDAEGNVVGAVEVKLGHVFDGDQAQAYEKAFGEETPLVLAGLDVDGEAAEVDADRWRYLRLSELFECWTRSSDAEAAAVASAATRVLAHWEREISSILDQESDQSVLARIDEPFLARILTRALRERVQVAGAGRAYASVTSGGGNAILQAFSSVSEKTPKREYIAEVRWDLNASTMDFRFGLDYPWGSQAERAELYAHAQRLDDAIRVDSFIAHLRSARPGLASLLATRGTGRPTAKGDWGEVVEHGVDLVDIRGRSPGFFRDKDFRLEAKSRVDLHRATAADVSALLTEALAYLAGSDRSLAKNR